MRRLCSRPGCSAAATTVFGFDPGASTVWLGVLTPDGPRDAGYLCDRHAAAMTPPHGWELEDRRGTIAVAAGVATEKPTARRPRKATAAHSGAHRAGATAAAPKVRKRRPRAPLERATATLPFDGVETVVGQGSKWGHAVAAAIPGEAVGTQRVAASVVIPAEALGSQRAAVTAATGATTRVDVPAVVPEAGGPVRAEERAVAVGWTPRFDRDDDLDGLLDAKTPLLGRAFRNIRSV